MSAQRLMVAGVPESPAWERGGAALGTQPQGLAAGLQWLAVLREGRGTGEPELYSSPDVPLCSQQ